MLPPSRSNTYLNSLLSSSFQYICYPWKDDSGVAPSERLDLCRNSKNCKSGQTCQRHSNKRSVTKGICLDKVRKTLTVGEANKSWALPARTPTPRVIGILLEFV